jgi:uncharacterized protein YfbU (UPF0304 family)
MTMAGNLKLSLTERIVLANQLRILEAVDPDEAKSYQHQRDALERGYESNTRNWRPPSPTTA